VATFEYLDSFGYSTVVADHCDLVVTSGIDVTKSITASSGASGGPSMRFADGSGSSDQAHGIRRNLASGGATRYIAFRLRLSALPPTNDVSFLHLLDDASVQLDFRVTALGAIKATRAGTLLGTSSNGIVAANVYRHYEVKVLIANSGGTIDIWQDGINVLSLSGLDTQVTANARINQVQLSYYTNGTHVTAINADFCDWVVSDSQINQARVDYFPGNAVGNSSQWTKSAGTNNYENIDETGSKDTADYNSTANVTDKDTFGFGNVPATSTVLCVGLIGLVDKQDAGTAGVKMGVRHSGTDYFGTEFAPPLGSIIYIRDFLAQNPGAGPGDWTPTDVNAAEIGYERSA